MKKDVLRLAAVFSFALATTACSTMSDVGDEVGSAVSEVGDALDPSGWFGDSTPPASTAQLPDSAVETPDLAALPPRPAPTATPESQAAIANSLSADRTQSGYSGEVLRGGTEAAAPPPPAAPRTAALPQAAPAPAPAALPDIAPAPAAQAALASEPAAPAPTAPVPVVPAPARVAAASSAAPAASAGARQPAVPPGSGGERVTVNTATPSDAALGFKPSTAPALDPNISQWVAPPIVQRFQQTAAQAGQRADMRVVANVPGASRSSAYAGARAAAAVIQFPGDGTTLSAQARAQVRTVAQAFKAQGGQGTVRVVGHASSRTANMPVERHLAVIFEKSQSRANAVAQELIKQGVPASKVLIEAVGDTQPIYYESMPEGENGNRRAEIFLQG